MYEHIKAFCATGFSCLCLVLTTSVVLLTLPFSAAFAAIYYVAPNGNDANPGTSSQPWRTIRKANTTLQAGDTVLISAGTYNEQIRPVRSGTSNSNRIVYRAAGNGDVILTGVVNLGEPKGGTIDLSQRKFVIVSGRPQGGADTIRQIKIRLTGLVAIYANFCGGEGNIIENTEMTYSGSRAPQRGVAFCQMFYKGRHETKNNILRNSRVVGKSSKSKDYDYFTEDLIDITSNAHHNLIENNIFETSKHVVLNSVSTIAHSNVIRNNIIRNRHHTSLSLWSTGAALVDGARFLVENNWLEASGDTVDPEGGVGNTFQWGADELIIRYNTITKGGSANLQNSTLGGLTGANGESYGAPYFATDGRVYNNTIIKNRGAALNMKDFGTASIGNRDLGRHVFVNNFFYDSDSSQTGKHLVHYWEGSDTGQDRYVANVFGNPGGNTSQSVLFASPGSASLAGAVASWRNPKAPELTSWNGFANVYDAAPGFAGYGGNDYTLVANSRYVDGGAPLTQVAPLDTGIGPVLLVDDSRFFFAEASAFPAWMGVQPDWIAVGPSLPSARKVQVLSIVDATNTIVLAEAISRQSGDFVWLWKDSDGTQVIYGAAPDVGAFEFPKTGEVLFPPVHLRVMQ